MDSFTHFFHFDTTEKLLMLDEIYCLGINPQIPSLDPPLGDTHEYKKDEMTVIFEKYAIA